MNWRDEAYRRRSGRAGSAPDLSREQFLAPPGVLHQLRAATAALPSRLLSVWTRSIQLRVAATTLLVTGAFVFITGVFLVNQLSAGVLRAKSEAAVRQADLGLANAQRSLSGVSPGDLSGIGPVLTQLSTPNDAGSSDNILYYTSILASAPALQGYLGGQPAIPDDLRAEVRAGKQATKYADLVPPGARSGVRSLIVGQPVSAPSGSFELYYIFPLTAERSTIALVQRTVLLVGIGVMLLIAAIAVLVTRIVVRPVRVVAATAGRLADGDLSQRLVVRGNDELAQLGRGFNEMAASLQRQIRRLEDLSRLQRRFTSDVSHELRTPLTTVRMAAEMLHSRRDEFPADLARSTELMYDELDRFEGLLGDLLEISRYDAGVARLELELVDVRAIARSVVSAMQPLADTQGSRVEVIAPETPVEAYVDPRRVERVLRNLLGNAIDHGEHRPITITVASDGSAVTFSVRDYGLGLRPGEASLVFNRFWRADPSRSRLTGGTGLGLAISLEDARLHGGWLQAWGERGAGALFRLTVPVDPDEPLPREAVPLMPDEADDIRSTAGAATLEIEAGDARDLLDPAGADGSGGR